MDTEEEEEGGRMLGDDFLENSGEQQRQEGERKSIGERRAREEGTRGRGGS